MSESPAPFPLTTASAEEVCDYLSALIRQTRKASSESQEAFARRAQIPLRTFKRLETSGKGTLETFVRVLIAMERVTALPLLFPQKPQPRKLSPQETIDAMRAKKR